jgi:hypothetical protein
VGGEDGVSKGVYNANSVKINNVSVLYCRTLPEVSAINNRTLGGLWFTQTIGDPAIKAEVQLVAHGMAARDNILDFHASGSPMMIEFDGYQRTGYIPEAPSVELTKRAQNVEKRIFVISFALAVNDEVAI